MTQISRFTECCVSIAQRVTGERGESAAPQGGGGFADYVLVSLHCLRIYLDTSYRMTIDLLKEMPQITGEIGLGAADLRAPSTLCKAFDRIEMSVCRVLLRQSAQLHIPLSTLRLMQHSTNDLLQAVTTVSESATASRNSKSRNSSIQSLKPSLTYTARRTGKEATQTLPSRSPAGMRAICGLLPPIKVMTSSHSVKHYVISTSDR